MYTVNWKGYAVIWDWTYRELRAYSEPEGYTVSRGREGPRFSSWIYREPSNVCFEPYSACRELNTLRCFLSKASQLVITQETSSVQ